jgi:hypothetical protein
MRYPVVHSGAGSTGTAGDLVLANHTARSSLFCGEMYVRLAPATGSADAGYPKAIAGNRLGFVDCDIGRVCRPPGRLIEPIHDRPIKT